MNKLGYRIIIGSRNLNNQYKLQTDFDEAAFFSTYQDAFVILCNYYKMQFGDSPEKVERRLQSSVCKIESASFDPNKKPLTDSTNSQTFELELAKQKQEFELTKQKLELELIKQQQEIELIKQQKEIEMIKQQKAAEQEPEAKPELSSTQESVQVPAQQSVQEPAPEPKLETKPETPVQVQEQTPEPVPEPKLETKPETPVQVQEQTLELTPEPKLETKPAQEQASTQVQNKQKLKPDAKPTAKSAPKLEQKQAQEDGTNETKKESEVKKTFNFEGGDKLSKLGAAWFVSYSYHKNISPEHLNWDQLQTSKSKVTLFKLTSNLHKTWLQNLLNVDESGLTNKIGLKPSQVKVMIKKLLDKN